MTSYEMKGRDTMKIMDNKQSFHDYEYTNNIIT
jgi:hypothetical protein